MAWKFQNWFSMEEERSLSHNMRELLKEIVSRILRVESRPKCSFYPTIDKDGKWVIGPGNVWGYNSHEHFTEASLSFIATNDVHLTLNVGINGRTGQIVGEEWTEHDPGYGRLTVGATNYLSYYFPIATLHDDEIIITGGHDIIVPVGVYTEDFELDEYYISSAPYDPDN